MCNCDSKQNLILTTLMFHSANLLKSSLLWKYIHWLIFMSLTTNSCKKRLHQMHRSLFTNQRVLEIEKLTMLIHKFVYRDFLFKLYQHAIKQRGLFSAFFYSVYSIYLWFDAESYVYKSCIVISYNLYWKVK